MTTATKTRTISQERKAIAKDYINAAARGIYLARLYETDGSPKMMERAEQAKAKVRRNTWNAASIMKCSYDEAFEMVSARYRERFL